MNVSRYEGIACLTQTELMIVGLDDWLSWVNTNFWVDAIHFLGSFPFIDLSARSYSLQIAKKTFIIQVYYHYGRNFQFLSKNYEAPSKIVEIKIKYIELLRIKSLNIESKVIKDLIQFIWSKFYELKVKKRPHNFWTTFGNSYLCYPHNCENFYNSSLLCDEGWRELLWSMRKYFVT